MESFGIVVAFGLAAVAATGLVLLVRGVRGRAVDDHPVCRRCRFDLVGLPTTSVRCSECGADLSRPRATVVGNRRRRPGLAAVGAVLILPGLLAVAVLAYASVANVRWIEHAPHWYLLRQATSPAAAVHDPALAEFARRQANSLLSDGQVASLVDAGLAHQADRAATWVPHWGDLIEVARAAGKVPDEKWRRYLVGAPAVSLSVRPEVRRGDKVVVRIHELPARCGTRSPLWAWIHYEVQPDSDLVPARANGGSMGTSVRPSSNGAFGHDFGIPPGKLAAAPDGPKALHVKVSVDLYTRTGRSSVSDKLPPEATATFDLRGSWSLLPADVATARPIDDPAHRAAVEQAIKIQSVRDSSDRKDYVDIYIDVRGTPVPLAYQVTLRAGGREWPRVTTLAVPAGANTTYGTGGEVKDFDADRVDVVLRPDPEVATHTVDFREYWNGEVVIKDVPVERPAAGQ